MGISSFSDLSSGLLSMLIVKAVILVATIKQKLCSFFRSLGFIHSVYNTEAAEYSDQQMFDDERISDGRMNISLAPQLSNLLSVDEEIFCQNPLLTLSSSSASNRNEDCAVCLCSLWEQDGHEISELSCCHMFHRSCIAKWLHYQLMQPTCPLCRSAQVYDVIIERDNLM